MSWEEFSWLLNFKNNLHVLSHMKTSSAEKKIYKVSKCQLITWPCSGPHPLALKFAFRASSEPLGSVCASSERESVYVSFKLVCTLEILPEWRDQNSELKLVDSAKAPNTNHTVKRLTTRHTLLRAAAQARPLSNRNRKLNWEIL